MLNLLELEQLIAFAEFGVPLFIRGKNRIELNETGLKAVEYARSLLTAAQNACSRFRLIMLSCIRLLWNRVRPHRFGRCFHCYPHIFPNRLFPQNYLKCLQLLTMLLLVFVKLGL